MIVNKPIIDKSDVSLFKWKIFGIGFLLLLVAVLMLWLMTCNKKNTTQPPNVIPSKEVRDTIYKIDKEQKRIADSLAEVIEGLQKDDVNNYNAYIKVLNENAALQNENYLLSQPVPDTCLPLQAAWIKRNNDLIKASNKADSACKKTINGLNKSVLAANKLAQEKDKAYNKMKSIADTASVALQKLEKYAKKIKPRSEIFAGITAIGDEIKPLTGYGVTLGLRNKKGTQFEIGALQFNNKILYQVGWKKTLFRL